METVRYDAQKNCFTKKGVPVPVLTKQLKAFVWPDYDYDAVARTRAPTKIGYGIHAVQKEWGGLAGGRLFHRRMQRVDESAPLQEQPSLLVQNALAMLQCIDLVVVGKEVPVYDVASNIATALDAVCRDADGKLWAVEYKSHMRESFFGGNAPMRAPILARFSNEPYNQAIVQLLCNCTMASAKYGRDLVGGVLLRVDEEMVDLVQVSDLKFGREILDFVTRCRRKYPLPRKQKNTLQRKQKKTAPNKKRRWGRCYYGAYGAAGKRCTKVTTNSASHTKT